MSDINFLDHKKSNDEEKAKEKDDKKDKFAWSSPKKENSGSKSSAFSFLPFMNRQALADKNKIKQSRQEILDLIKQNPKPRPKKETGNFFSSLVEKLKGQPAPKKVLLDYQQVFNQEKEHKNQTGEIFAVKPAPAENKPAAVKPVVKIQEKSVPAKETREEVKPARPRVLETNLIQGELITFFDWRAKAIILASAILIPVFAVGAIYYGLLFYQKSTQAKNLEQEKKFAELEKNILKEESDLKEIFAFQTRLKLVSQIFEQHIYWTNFFKFLEDNTIKDVYFINFDGDTSGNYVLDALASDYGAIAEQVKVFKNNKKVTDVSVNGGELSQENKADKSAVKFTLNFSVLKNIFTE